jgi:hypothetical protein
MFIISFKKSLPRRSEGEESGGLFFWIPDFAGQARRARKNYAEKSRLKAAPTGCKPFLLTKSPT